MKARGLVTAGGYIASVVLTNMATAHFGLWPVGFGLTATAGTMLAGASLVLRDAVQEAASQRAALASLGFACAISAWMATPVLALASVAAFGLSELLDMGVYTKLRGRGWIRAAATSNAIGAIVDTFVFLWVAGFPVTGLAVAGQIVGKGWATVAVVAPVLVTRLVRSVRGRRAVSDNTFRR